MDLLCLSNGHGEDAIAVRVLKALKQLSNPPNLAALPLVGEGVAYYKAGIKVLGPTQAMPSGGFIYMDQRQMWSDLKAGLLGLTLGQWQTLRSWANNGGKIFAVGDVVPLAMAWASGADYAFLGTAKSEYYLRNDTDRLPGRPSLEGWGGSIYLPWERWLMGHRRCRHAFVRDQLTADYLQRCGVAADYVGNPMMDGLEVDAPTLSRLTTSFLPDQRVLSLVLIPGSRAPEAFDNWQRILVALESVAQTFPDRQLRLLGAIAPGLNLAVLSDILQEHQWQPLAGAYPSFSRGKAQLILTQDAFAECLHLADAAIATAGTATEQAVGLGKPVFTLPGEGPQFTYAFAEAQLRLLGPSIQMINDPTQTGPTLSQCLGDSNRLQAIHANGQRRMGPPGAAREIALRISRL
jgi:uncharacterized protein (TIGR03492 family)